MNFIVRENKVLGLQDCLAREIVTTGPMCTITGDMGRTPQDITHIILI